MAAEQLRGKHVALLGFSLEDGVALRTALESRGGIAAAVMPSATNLSLVCQVFDLLVWAVPAACKMPSPAELDELSARLLPVVWVGPREQVAPLTFARPGTWDYSEVLQPIDTTLWRAGMLLALKENRNGLSAVRRRAKPDTVLVLDDHAISRALVERTLASTGLVCLQLPEGMPALQFIRESRPAVVVMELNTSTEEGFDLLQAARQDLSLAPTRFVVLSAQRGEPEVIRAFGLGADDYVTKPFSPLELAARVRRLVRQT